MVTYPFIQPNLGDYTVFIGKEPNSELRYNEKHKEWRIYRIKKAKLKTLSVKQVKELMRGRK